MSADRYQPTNITTVRTSSKLRPLLLSFAAVTSLLTLSACAETSPNAAPPAGCEASDTTSSETLEQRVTGDFGVSAKLAPGTAESTKQIVERAQLQESKLAGGGPYLGDAGSASVNYAVYSDTGEVLSPYASLGQPAPSPNLAVSSSQLKASLPGLQKALRCAQSGQRVLVNLASKDLLGAETLAANPATPGRITIVADLIRVFPASSEGRIAAPVSGIPAVVTAPDGTPGITIPKQPAPDTPEVYERVLGGGHEIKDGDRVIMQIAAYSWKRGTLIASTWKPQYAPLTMTVGNNPEKASPFFGMENAFIGKRIGSQLVMVVPASDVAEKPGPFLPNEAEGGAAILVVDLLADLNDGA